MLFLAGSRARAARRPKLTAPARGQRAPQSYEEVGHSDNAEKILQRFKVGELPREPSAFDGLPLVPITCALLGAGGMLALRALARKASAGA